MLQPTFPNHADCGRFLQMQRFLRNSPPSAALLLSGLRFFTGTRLPVLPSRRTVPSGRVFVFSPDWERPARPLPLPRRRPRSPARQLRGPSSGRRASRFRRPRGRRHATARMPSRRPLPCSKLCNIAFDLLRSMRNMPTFFAVIGGVVILFGGDLDGAGLPRRLRRINIVRWLDLRPGIQAEPVSRRRPSSGWGKRGTEVAVLAALPSWWLSE
jgi:hypothetical protein